MLNSSVDLLEANLNFGVESDFSCLLAYYRTRIESAEKEREDWLEKVENLRVRQESLHKLEWEIKKRNEEKDELNRQLRQKELVLEQGRENLVALAKQQEEILNTQQADRDKLVRVLGETEAVQQQVFLNKGQTASNVYSYQGGGKAGPKHILRTIHLPCAQSETLGSQREALISQIEAQRVHYNELVAQERENQRFKEGEMRKEFEERAKLQEELIQRICKAQEGKTSEVRELVRLKHEFQERQKSLVEELTELKLHQSNLLSNYYSAVKQTSAKESSPDLAHEFRHQAQEAESQLALVKDQTSNMQSIFNQKISELEERFSSLQKKYKQLQQRKKLETEGFASQMTGLESRIETIKNPRPTFEKTKTEDNPKVCKRCLDHGVKFS